MKKKSIFDFFSRPSNISRREDPVDLSDLTGDQLEMVRGVADLPEMTVKEVIVPRIDVVFIPEQIEFRELMEKITESGHSRFPVYKDTIDNVIGILYVKDLLRNLLKLNFVCPEVLTLNDIIRKPFFVPDSKKLADLLKEFKKRRVHIAVAVDEYGGVSGILCLEDILEEIVGDLQDEFDESTPEIISLGEGTWLCDARAPILELNATLKMDFPNEDFDTLGGFVFDLFGKIPVRYEKKSWEGVDFVIQAMEGYKIKTVKVITKTTEAQNEN